MKYDIVAVIRNRVFIVNASLIPVITLLSYQNLIVSQTDFCRSEIILQRFKTAPPEGSK